MSLEYKQNIDIPPIEVASNYKLRQAVKFNNEISNETDYHQAKQKALQDILNTTMDSDPSEINRLRLLYKEVYTTKELENLTENILDDYLITEF